MTKYEKYPKCETFSKYKTPRKAGAVPLGALVELWEGGGGAGAVAALKPRREAPSGTGAGLFPSGRGQNGEI